MYAVEICCTCKLEAMEATHPLSIESFSYSWLVNLKPSLESLDNSLRTSIDASDEASFIEMDPTMSPSKRFFMINSQQQDFKFDFPAAISQSPLATLVHADELISNGYLLPLSVDSLKNMEAHHDHHLHEASPVSPHSPREVAAIENSRDCSNSLKKCRRLSRRIFEKYLNFLRPLYKKIRGDHHHQKSSTTPKAGNNFDKRSHSVKKCRVHSSSETSQSPRISLAYSTDDWRRSCDSESSIYEAVLHCKRSIGN